MTSLSLAARNQLAQDTELTALLGKSLTWDTWIFDERPIGVKIENTQKCLIVVNEEDQADSPNEHNTLLFPSLVVDVWADPTRNDDKSVRVYDAKNKIEAISRLVNRHFHTVDMGTPQGGPLIWGTAEEVAEKTGVVVAASARRSGPTYSPVRDSDGSFMGRLVYAVHQL